MEKHKNELKIDEKTIIKETMGIQKKNFEFQKLVKIKKQKICTKVY